MSLSSSSIIIVVVQHPSSSCCRHHHHYHQVIIISLSGHHHVIIILLSRHNHVIIMFSPPPPVVASWVSFSKSNLFLNLESFLTFSNLFRAVPSLNSLSQRKTNTTRRACGGSTLAPRSTRTDTASVPTKGCPSSLIF